MTLVVRTFRERQRRAGPGPYRFQRAAENPTDTLGGEGYGAPTRKVGLIHSMFRSSDDACTYPFMVPANAFIVLTLTSDDDAEIHLAARKPALLRQVLE